MSTESEMQAIRDDLKLFEGRFDHHLEIYGRNGKELEAVKTNLAWLIKFFWIFMSPMAAGIVYLVLHIK